MHTVRKKKAIKLKISTDFNSTHFLIFSLLLSVFIDFTNIHGLSTKFWHLLVRLITIILALISCISTFKNRNSSC